ncbi:DUF6083 domain-containing protein [Streptomyces sp. NBC_01230]|uniref:DUF6083 domain-containing protein n=1 Tax=unclassified Streptomyces TaxID=2593676 RepID=UPI002E15B560|nr:DUF6083 domain-containing protein [Streptomyces sp. NBC_01230]
MSSTASSGRQWDGTPNRPHRQRTLRVAHDSPTRLVRSAQPSRCRDCGNRIDWYTRTADHPVSLHPHELDATTVPAATQWHVSSGIAHPADDGTPWCRIPHLALCPARDAPTLLSPQIAALRRHLALHTRRLLDTGTLTPPTPTPAPSPHPHRTQPHWQPSRCLAARPGPLSCSSTPATSPAAPSTPSSA